MGHGKRHHKPIFVANGCLSVSYTHLDVYKRQAAYTARYMTKKLKGRDAKQQYTEAGINPEFCLCSRKPGIGYGYYELHKD